MRTVTYSVSSLSPYSPCRPVSYLVPKKNKESPEAFEERTWRLKAHADEKTGMVYIPPMAFKMSLTTSSSRLAIKVPGKGQRTYGAYIKSGVIPLDNAWLNVTRDDFRQEPVFCSATGKANGVGTRVIRYFPILDDWKTDVTLQVADDSIPEDIVDMSMREAGKLIGVGRFRPEVGGYFGRFDVTKVKWTNLDE